MTEVWISSLTGIIRSTSAPWDIEVDDLSPKANTAEKSKESGQTWDYAAKQDGYISDSRLV